MRKIKKIILDADVIIHFYKAGHLGLLPQIYSNKLYIVKDVLDEVILTTLDLLNRAYEKNLLDEGECDYFIYNVKSKGSRLPVNSIKEFRKLKK